MWRADLGYQLDQIVRNANEFGDYKHAAKAYAALTLARILEPEWTHMVTRKVSKDEVVHETVIKPAGQTVGSREELQARLDALLLELQ
jgi:hypothetical protein